MIRQGELGSQMLEASLWLFFVSTMFLSGIGLYDGVRCAYEARHLAEVALRTTSLRPLTLYSMAGGASTQVNLSDVAAFISTNNGSFKKALLNLGYPAYAEMGAAKISINPATGIWKNDLESLSRNVLADFTLPDGATDLVPAFKSFASAAQPPSQPSALSVPATVLGGTTSYLDASVLVGARGAIDLGTSFTGIIWKALTGTSVIQVNKITILRGDISKVQL